MFAIRLLLLLILISACTIGKGQNTTSPDNRFQAADTSNIKIHSPHKATIYSALVPGLGQIYNKKYWKLPIIYGATGIFIYIFDFNNDLYNKYKTAYADLKSGKIERFQNVTIDNIDVLQRAKDEAVRNRDLNVILLAALYLLNVVDATVDAHLFDYKITDDLSLKFQPSIKKQYGNQESYGLTLQLNF